MTQHGEYDYDREQELINQKLAHIPVPDGAQADEWSVTRHDDGDGIRSLEWATFDTSHPGVGVDVAGVQRETGEIDRYILVWAESKELTSGQARELAEVLIRAADKLDSLQ